MPPAAGEPPVHLCDELAANPFDPQRVAPGVPLARLEGTAAVAACRDALAAHPQVPRFLYQLGRSLLRADQPEEAAAMVRDAAAGGYAAAIMALGNFLENGWGMPQDLAEAARLYERSTVPAGTFALASLYWDGRGRPQDRAEALRLFEIAADRGAPLSHQFLARLYERGDGVERDPARAMYHHAVAARLFDRLGMSVETRQETERRAALAHAVGVAVAAQEYRRATAWRPVAAP